MLALAIWLLSLLDATVPDDVTDAVCAETVLTASRAYAPTTWTDAVVDLDAPLTFAIPEALPVTQGNAGNKRASLTFRLAGGAAVSCTYEGGSPVAHPSDPGDVLQGLAYVLRSCDDGSVAGELATADHLELHVQNGDSQAGTTTVEVALADATCALDDGPCADGTWGGITWLEQTVHVRADGDDANDGSLAAPVATVARALELTRSWGAVGHKAIAVGPGTFDATVALDQPDDAETWLMGCSPAETVLLGSDPARPVVELAMPGAGGVQGLSLQGGGVGLHVRGGPDAFVEDVAIVTTGAAGLKVEDAATFTLLRDVEITDPLGDAGACGWGVAVDEATVVALGTTIQGAQEVGLGASDANVVMLGFEVAGTWQNGLGMLGRGVHAQHGWTLLYGGRLVDNFDAGVFLLEPTGGVILQVQIEFTSAGITAAGGQTGDGVVVTGAAQSQVLIVDNVVVQNDRGGIVVDESDAYVKDNLAAGSGLANGIRQNATVSGPQAMLMADLSATPVDLVKDPLSCH